MLWTQEKIPGMSISKEKIAHFVTISGIFQIPDCFTVLYNRLDLMRRLANKDYASVHLKPRFKTPTQPKGILRPECYW